MSEEEKKYTDQDINDLAYTMREVLNALDKAVMEYAGEPMTKERIASINEFITMYKSSSLDLFRAAGGWADEVPDDDMQNLGTLEERRSKVEAALKKYNFRAEMVMDVEDPLFTDESFGGEFEKTKYATFLEDVFAKHHFSKTSENLDIPSKHTRWDQLYTDLLAKNPGIAFADVHHSRGIADHVGSNLTMRVLAESNVQRIFIEVPSSAQEYIAQFNKSGSEEDLQAVKDYLSLYPSKGNEDELFRMIKNAQKNNIEIVAFDDEDVGASTLRVSRSNFNWTDRIKEQTSDLKPGEKYVVWCGIAHVGDTVLSKGMVDEGLGIPTVGYLKSDPKTDGKFTRENGDLFDYAIHLGDRGISREEYKSYQDPVDPSKLPKKGDEVTQAR